MGRAEGDEPPEGALRLLTQRQEAIAARLRADAMIAGLAPRKPRDWAAELGIPCEELLPLLSHLVRDGSLCRAPGDCYFDRVAVDELRARVIAHLRSQGGLDAPAWEALLGEDHPHAAPLQALFDQEGVTAPRGERRAPGPAPAEEG